LVFRGRFKRVTSRRAHTTYRRVAAKEVAFHASPARRDENPGLLGASQRKSREAPFLQMKLTPKEKSARIDLGLAILSATRPGKQLSCAEIAAYCDCTPEAIRHVEQKALARLRRGLKNN
jgi:DNA-directed RNA polymerase specialized sigma24 family protein